MIIFLLLFLTNVELSASSTNHQNLITEKLAKDFLGNCLLKNQETDPVESVKKIIIYAKKENVLTNLLKILIKSFRIELDQKNQTEKYLSNVVFSCNNKGMGLLHFAAAYAHPEIVELLLNEGMDPCTLDTDGNSPLSYARMYRRQENEQLLLKYVFKNI
ncbi:ankyrin repeat domain-containing protein [Candidatus Babeliales bacterium]|nr:ankyrin repeat domain-containing protein [Candidatus Babeliales bacterium]